ncbi:DMT family transporter [Peribacillus asahii]|uniref:Quaternary ammonium transporter n=1 Tax=Peribacillus asahii TaxID=228899 RepID=A0A3Q9RP07_9BACI|nr:multidrug efflux SMR transporter [Peribacillus asahii]AZV43486.1 quaternary ammonium transporter [Peribacillus asahii]USK83466.1 multidrug efflux SMR transporter [Peribacillus asahii]
MGYLWLAIAIIAEVFGSSMLKLTGGFKKLVPTIGVIIGYGIAFYALSLSLSYLPLGVAYAIWAGAGTALTALVGVVVYKEGLDMKKSLGILLVIGGVVLLKSGI